MQNLSQIYNLTKSRNVASTMKFVGTYNTNVDMYLQKTICIKE